MILDKFILGVWNIGIIEKKYEELINEELFKIRWVKHTYRDRFFADPFLLKHDEQFYYILAEEFVFSEDIGWISLLVIDKQTMELKHKRTVLSSEYHFSYPFVYNDKVIPECYASGLSYDYRYDEEKLIQDGLIMNRGLIDQTFLQYNNTEWVFATDKDNPLYGLKIFYKAIGDTEWKEHKKNPVKSDIESSRPGGHFFEIDGKIYRPVQDSKKRYGHQIRIMRVDQLTPEEFKEEEVAHFSSINNPPYNMGLHTFNVEDGFIVVDGYREYHSFFVKPMSLKFPAIMKRFSRLCYH